MLEWRCNCSDATPLPEDKSNTQDLAHLVTEDAPVLHKHAEES